MLNIIQHPTIQYESDTADFMDKILIYVVTRSNVENLPGYAKEDGEDIINEFKDNLTECKKELDETHHMNDFKVCVHKQIEVAENSLWDLENSLLPSSSNSLAFCKLLIYLIAGFFYLHF